MAEVDWTVDLFERPVSIDLMEQGHKLEHFLGETIGRPLHIGSRPPSDQIPYPHVEFVARTPDLTSTLNVILLTTGAYALVAGTGEPREEAVAPWRDAVAAALARLHEDDQEHSWAAVIGPMPSGNGVWQHLSAEATVGGLRLLPPEVLYREFIEDIPPSFGWAGAPSPGR